MIFNKVKTDIKKTWNVINTLLKPNFSTTKNHIKVINYLGTSYTDNQSIANCLNTHFASVGANISNSLPNHDEQSFDFPCSVNSMFFRATNPAEINKVILSLNNKASHISTYPSKILKYASDVISPILCIIVNMSLENGIFPDKLKVARVVPIHKGGDFSDVNNYRPVSVLPILSKIFERIVHNQLMCYLDKFNILSEMIDQVWL